MLIYFDELAMPSASVNSLNKKLRDKFRSSFFPVDDNEFQAKMNFITDYPKIERKGNIHASPNLKA